jgi:hypothetical protein
VVQEFSCRNLIFVDSSDEIVKEVPKAQEPTPSISSDSKGNPPKEPVKEAPIVELPKKYLAEAKTKCRKKDLTRLDLSMEKHQAAPSLNDVSTLLCYLFELCYCN